MLFDHLGLDTEEVLEAAGTKWNFLNFRPGLVGGHCIGVDPYYLTHRATQAGYHPEIILAGIRLNDSMAEHVVDKLVRAMSERAISIVGANILVMGPGGYRFADYLKVGGLLTLVTLVVLMAVLPIFWPLVP